MAIIKKYNPNNIYISGRLNNRLKTIENYPLTIVETPTGFGKTTIVREYLKINNIKYIWFNIDTSDKGKFFLDFSKRMESVSENCARILRTMGFPKDSDSAAIIAKALMDLEFREKTILVIDNYHLICDENFNCVMKDLSQSGNVNFSICCLTQAITSNITFDLILKKKLNYLSKGDFELNQEEIIEYYKNCGIKLENEEAEFLYQYTEGWISALYLQMLSYAATNKFEPTVSVDNLVCKDIWDNLNRKEQDFLISMSVFHNFSFRQSIEVAGDIISEDEIDKLLGNNAFIKYDSKSRKYYIHSILRYFLEIEFEKLDPLFKKKIYKGAGDWFSVNEEYFNAIKFYYKINDYESILKMNYTGKVIIPEMNYGNKELFINIVLNVPEDLKMKYCRKFLIFVMALFVYNERDTFSHQCQHMKKLIMENNELSEIEKEATIGESMLLNALIHFNDIFKMKEIYIEAFDKLRTPSKLFDGRNSITFNNPSPLCAYHSKPGNLDNEIECLDETMPYFYKLFHGAGKGTEALMRAEALLNRGLFDDATILCEKAKYMAETRDEAETYISAVFVLSRINYFKADYVSLNNNIELIKKKIENTGRFDLINMADMCEGYLRVALESPELVPSWLKDHVSIEKFTRIHSLGFANLIYAKYLIQKERYSNFLAISGQMLGISNIFNNCMYKIYTYIYLAITKNILKSYDKAIDFLTEAINLAKEDNIIIPFVENYNGIYQVIDSIRDEDSLEFRREVKKYSKKYAKGLRASTKASKNDQSYGLTKRELEVAKLAAKRFTNKEIADMLFIAESTVKSNLKVVFSKLNINSRGELKNYFE